jgi:hypothetical protein
MIGWVLLIAVVVIIFILIGMYNSLVRLKVQVDNAWADIDVQLKRRYDLIPNLVETVKGYAGHEKGTLEAVINARNRAMTATAEKPLRSLRSLPAAPRHRKLHLAAKFPHADRRHCPKCPPLLQRRRPRSQHQNPAVPHQHLRRHARLQAPRILRSYLHHRTRGPQSQLQYPRHSCVKTQP